MTNDFSKENNDSVATAYKLGSEDARSEERERCAKVAEALDMYHEGIDSTQHPVQAVDEAKACIAAKIRSGE